MRCVSLVTVRVVVVVAPLTTPGAQLFQLWDRVIGFDRLEILAVLAAAVFVFRSRALLNAHSEEEMQCVFGVRELGMCQQGLTHVPRVCQGCVPGVFQTACGAFATVLSVRGVTSVTTQVDRVNTIIVTPRTHSQCKATTAHTHRSPTTKTTA